MSGSREDPGAGAPSEEGVRERAPEDLLHAQEPLAALESKLGDFVGFVCAEIDGLREGLELPENSRVIADFDRLTHAMARLRSVLVEKRTDDEPDAAETFLDLMEEENGVGTELDGASPSEGTGES